MFALIGKEVPSLMLINFLYNLLNTERCLRRNKCATNISECMMNKHYSVVVFFGIDNYIPQIALGIGDKNEREIALQTVVSMVLCPPHKDDLRHKETQGSKQKRKALKGSGYPRIE